MSADKVWVCCNAADDYVEFERTLEGFGPPGDECQRPASPIKAYGAQNSGCA